MRHGTVDPYSGRGPLVACQVLFWRIFGSLRGSFPGSPGRAPPGAEQRWGRRQARGFGGFIAMNVPPSDFARVQPDPLRRFVREAFGRVGMPPDQAELL